MLGGGGAAPPAPPAGRLKFVGRREKLKIENEKMKELWITNNDY